MTTLPTEQEIEALHRKYASSPEAFDRIYTHCRIVWDIARQIINQAQLDVDEELVKAGCLLHDIGAYTLFQDGRFDKVRYITHGVVGYELLKKEGYSEQLCRIASHHTGTGLLKEEIQQQNLPLPHEDFMADTIEEKLVMYADKFHSKHPRFNAYESYKKTVSKFGDANVKRFELLADLFGVPQLDALARKYQQDVI